MGSLSEANQKKLEALAQKLQTTTRSRVIVWAGKSGLTPRKAAESVAASNNLTGKNNCLIVIVALDSVDDFGVAPSFYVLTGGEMKNIFPDILVKKTVLANTNGKSTLNWFPTAQAILKATDNQAQSSIASVNQAQGEQGSINWFAWLLLFSGLGSAGWWFFLRKRPASDHNYSGDTGFSSTSRNSTPTQPTATTDWRIVVYLLLLRIRLATAKNLSKLMDSVEVATVLNLSLLKVPSVAVAVAIVKKSLMRLSLKILPVEVVITKNHSS